MLGAWGGWAWNVAWAWIWTLGASPDSISAGDITTLTAIVTYATIILVDPATGVATHAIAPVTTIAVHAISHSRSLSTTAIISLALVSCGIAAIECSIVRFSIITLINEASAVAKSAISKASSVVESAVTESLASGESAVVWSSAIGETCSAMEITSVVTIAARIAIEISRAGVMISRKFSIAIFT